MRIILNSLKSQHNPQCIATRWLIFQPVPIKKLRYPIFSGRTASFIRTCQIRIYLVSSFNYTQPRSFVITFDRRVFLTQQIQTTKFFPHSFPRLFHISLPFEDTSKYKMEKNKWGTKMDKKENRQRKNVYTYRVFHS